MGEFLAVAGCRRGTAGKFLRVLGQGADGDTLAQNVAQAEGDPQPALDPVDLGKALVPEDEPPRAVEHAKTLGHVAERGVAQVLLHAVRRGEPVEAAAEAEPDRRAGGDRRNAGGPLHDQVDGDGGTEDDRGADGDPHRAGAPARLPRAGEDSGGG